MLVLRRDEVAEDRVTLKNLIELQVALPITTDELNANRMAELLGQLEMKHVNYRDLSREYSNCYSNIADQLLIEVTKYNHKGALKSGEEP